MEAKKQDPHGKDVLKKIDLAPCDGPLPGTLPEGFQSKMQDLVCSMLRAAEKVNMAAEKTQVLQRFFLAYARTQLQIPSI